jgi:hypothetical protein
LGIARAGAVATGALTRRAALGVRGARPTRAADARHPAAALRVDRARCTDAVDAGQATRWRRSAERLGVAVLECRARAARRVDASLPRRACASRKPTRATGYSARAADSRLARFAGGTVGVLRARALHAAVSCLTDCARPALATRRARLTRLPHADLARAALTVRRAGRAAAVARGAAQDGHAVPALAVVPETARRIRRALGGPRRRDPAAPLTGRASVLGALGADAVLACEPGRAIAVRLARGATRCAVPRKGDADLGRAARGAGACGRRKRRARIRAAPVRANPGGGIGDLAGWRAAPGVARVSRRPLTDAIAFPRELTQLGGAVVRVADPDDRIAQGLRRARQRRTARHQRGARGRSVHASIRGAAPLRGDPAATRRQRRQSEQKRSRPPHGKT